MELDLIKKYNQPVPRYTSYPPANHFKDNFQYSDYEYLIKESNQWDPSNLSIYIHIPFCIQQCFYCGCNSNPISSDSQITNYISALKKEIELVFRLLNKNRKVSQIHFGGGTPNAIPPFYLKELIQLIFSYFDAIEDPEIAIECHPGYLDKKILDELLCAGFNRFSFGVQDFNEEVLTNVNRKPSQLPMPELVNFLKKKGIDSINLDFIYGLPGQTVYSFIESIQQAIDLDVDRLVTFSYAHIPWINRKQLVLEEIGLPGSAEKSVMFLEANKLLLSKGYKMIGMDHYVKKKDELFTAQQSEKLHRNFQGYASKRTTGQVYAFGTSAISQFQYGYAQNTKSIGEYINSIEKSILPVTKGYILNEKEYIIRESINELMCNKNLNFNALSDKLKINRGKILSSIKIIDEKLITFEKDGIIEWNKNEIKITEKGSFFVRNVVASIDPLMDVNTKLYSKSV
jgi:oxygen-independent coproporphyrinogen-3 oxidase